MNKDLPVLPLSKVECKSTCGRRLTPYKGKDEIFPEKKGETYKISYVCKKGVTIGIYFYVHSLEKNVLQ